MSYFNRNRVLIGLVILITVINLASLGTIIYLESTEDNDRWDYKDKKEFFDRKDFDDRDKRPPFRTERFRNYMDSVRKNFRREVSPHARDIRMNQSAIMQELMKENPDREKLDSLARQAGEMHYRIKRNMIEIFMERNRQSDSSEREYLRRFYRHFMVDPPHERHMKKRHHRHDHDDKHWREGKREGRRWKN